MQLENIAIEKRAEMRRQVSLRAYALSPKHDADVTVTDLSYDGCAILSAACCRLGELIELIVVRRGSMQAEICLVKEERAGVRFHH